MPNITFRLSGSDHESKNKKPKKSSTPIQSKKKKKIEKNVKQTTNEVRTRTKTVSHKRQFRRCCRSFVSFLFSRIGLCLVIFAYSIIGGFCFRELEKQTDCDELHKLYEINEKNEDSVEVAELEMTITSNFCKERLIANQTEERDKRRNHFILQLQQLLLHNVFSQKSNRNLTDLLTDYQFQYLFDYNENKYDNNDFNFANSILYSITVITTIGYGQLTCRTINGKLVTIAYAVFGIPIMLLCLANLGSTMADIFRFVYARICCAYCNLIRKNQLLNAYIVDDPLKVITMPLGGEFLDEATSKKQKITRERMDRMLRVDYRAITVPISVTLFVLTIYIIGGGLLFSRYEKWEPIDGAYFCFITLSTIGLGDLVPGQSISLTNGIIESALNKTNSVDLNNEKKDQIEKSYHVIVFVTLYLVVGLAMICMCFNLMQEDVRVKFRKYGNRLGLFYDSGEYN
ncbi:hypothetical protein SNEBB_009322 [Seison nebaliae]|nr:hypothetical protein SNEBB_009322 [Seison nebaliae]